MTSAILRVLWPFGSWIKTLLFVLAVGLVLRCSVADVGRVSGGSMRPTLRDGDYLVTNKMAYGLRLPGTHIWPMTWSDPRRGDVVLLTSPVDGRRLVKRIVGVPGDGQVPAGHYFVQGDDPNSLDSRTFGCVPRERILGRVVATTAGRELGHPSTETGQ